MGHRANVIPFHCAESDPYDPDQLRLHSGEIPSTKVDAGTQAERRAARDRLFIPTLVARGRQLVPAFGRRQRTKP